MENHLAVHRYPAGVRHRRWSDSTDRERDVDQLVPSIQAALDRITYLAGEALDVAAVCASLVDEEGRLVMSSYGLGIPTALLIAHAFRQQVVASRRPLVVVDGCRDPLVANNPAVRDGTVRACVGMPLRRPDGRPVGTLLAMDRKPRPWTAPQLDLLGKLSALIVSEVELAAAVRRALQGDAPAALVADR